MAQTHPRSFPLEFEALKTAFWAPTASTVDIGAPLFGVLLTGVIAAAWLLQIVLYRGHFFALSADESARTIIADRLTWSNALEPFIWPPFGKVVMGLALKLHHNLIVTPRVLAGFFGTLVTAGVAFLGYRLSGLRIVALVAAALSVVVPHRLLLSVAPLSDIYAFAFILFAAASVYGWMKTGRASDLLVGCVLLLVAATVRYEAWFFNVVLAFYLLYRLAIRRDMSFRLFVEAGAILAFFPTYWLVHTYVHTGSLEIFSLTSKQFLDIHGRDWAMSLNNNLLVLFIKDLIVGPVLILGLLGLLFGSISDRALREWALVFFLPLGLIALNMLVTFGVPLAAPFRIDGSWVLLLIPAAALVIVRWAAATAQRPLAQLAVAGLLTLGFAFPFYDRSMTHLHVAKADTQSILTTDDIDLGKALQQRLAGTNEQVLIDALDTLDYLNVLVAANEPERFVLNVDEEPVLTGLYVHGGETVKPYDDPVIRERFLTDKFALAEGGDLAKMAARNIGFVVSRNAPTIAALNANPRLVLIEQAGPWQVFAVTG